MFCFFRSSTRRVRACIGDASGTATRSTWLYISLTRGDNVQSGASECRAHYPSAADTQCLFFTAVPRSGPASAGKFESVIYCPVMITPLNYYRATKESEGRGYCLWWIIIVAVIDVTRLWRAKCWVSGRLVIGFINQHYCDPLLYSLSRVINSTRAIVFRLYCSKKTNIEVILLYHQNASIIIRSGKQTCLCCLIKAIHNMTAVGSMSDQRI